ncbi:unnamed protein product, partial [Ectocarpus sp. 8 AP-2014]
IGPAHGTPTACPLQTLPRSDIVSKYSKQECTKENTHPSSTTKHKINRGKTKTKRRKHSVKNCVTNRQHAEFKKAGIPRSISTADAYNETMGPSKRTAKKNIVARYSVKRVRPTESNTDTPQISPRQTGNAINE